MADAFHAVPGSVVEMEGELFLVEHVFVSVTMQRLERLTTKLLPGTDFQDMSLPPHCPVFHRVQGELGSADLAKIHPLQRMDQA
jgi:hypothetical protein